MRKSTPIKGLFIGVVMGLSFIPSQKAFGFGSAIPNQTILPPNSQTPDQACPGSIPSQAEIDRRIGLLKTTITQAMATTSPHYADITSNSFFKGTETLFTGNWDWHSSVHAFWAMLSMARVTKDTALRDSILARLTPAAIQNETSILNLSDNHQPGTMNQQFEVPYGQAWLLMLLSEVSKTSIGNRPDIVQLHSDTLNRLMTYLETFPFPEHPEAITGYRLQGAQDSWLFAYFLLQLSEKDPQILKRLDAQRQLKIEPARSQISTNFTLISDFIYLPALMAAVDETSYNPTVSSAAPPYPVIPDPGFEATPTTATEHLTGQILVRNWPHAIQSANNPASCARYQTRMTEIFNTPNQWQMGFEEVTHWIPQFIWMSMWLQMGRP